jgi:GxxExxY protein
MLIGKQTDLTEKIIGAFFEVYNELGYGFSERVYENAMVIELRNLGLKVNQQNPGCVYYAGHLVGEYFADISVEDKVLYPGSRVKNIREIRVIRVPSKET